MPSQGPAQSLVALLHGPDQVGLVARVAGWIFERGGNILHADQHRDEAASIFFQRVEWIPAGEAEAEAVSFRAFGGELGMRVRVVSRAHRPRVAIFVSRFDHCFHDLLLRWKAGEYPCEVAAVVSNHADLAAEAARYGVPYNHVPVTAARKAEAEARQLAILEKEGVELGILARYMQVLSGNFLAEAPCPFINIHHSFLPAFTGAKPYHQAHVRGVKLIGATAHYATAELDAGPIIHQAVAPVSHRDSIPNLVRKGRDLEKQALSTAVRWHLDQRVLAFNNKTVVFD